MIGIVAVVAVGFAIAGTLAARYAESLLLDQVLIRGKALLSAMAGHVLGRAELVGTYER